MTVENETAPGTTREGGTRGETQKGTPAFNSASSADDSATSPLDTWIGLAALGYYLFPIRSTKKRAAHEGWQNESTRDPAKIRAWADRGYDMAINCEKSNLVVLDGDAPGVLDVWRARCPEEVRETLTVRSGREGGEHALYRAPKGMQIRSSNKRFRDAGLKIDVKARGGLVVAPGSLHESGRRYEITKDLEPAELPASVVDEWLLPVESVATKYVDGLGPKPSFIACEAPRERTPSAGDIDYLNGVLEDEFSRLRDAQGWPLKEGSWRQVTLDVANRCALVHNAAPDAFPLDALHDRFLEDAPTDREWTVGKNEDRWTDALKDIGGWAKILPDDALSGPAHDFDPLGPEDGTGDAGTTSEDAGDGFNFLDFGDLLDGAEVEPDYVMWPFLQRGTLASLSSEAKAGKSLLVLEAVFCAITGRAMFGVGPRNEPVTVMYLDQENSRRDLKKRLMAMGATATDLRRLHYASFPAVNALDTPEQANRVIRQVQRLRPDVVVFDTASRFVAGEENDAPTWLRLYRLLHAPLKSLGVAQLRIDHLGKDHSKGARGSSAKDGDIDDGWILRRDADDPRARRLLHPLTRNGDGPTYVCFVVEDGPLRHVITSTDDPSILEQPFAPVDPADALIQALNDLDPDGKVTTFDEQSLALRKAGHQFKTDVLREARRRLKGTSR